MYPKRNGTTGIGAAARASVMIWCCFARSWCRLCDRSRGVLHDRLPYHFGQEIHLPFRVGNVLVDEIGVRQRFLYVPKGVEGSLAVSKVDGEHFKKLLLDLRFGEVDGGAFDLIMELVDALPHQTAVLIGGVPGDGRILRTAITAEYLCGKGRVAEGSLRLEPISQLTWMVPISSTNRTVPLQPGTRSVR